MRLVLILFILFTYSSAFNYRENIHFERFLEPELNKISDVQLEITKLQKENSTYHKEFLESLDRERDRLVSEFINKFINNEYSTNRIKIDTAKIAKLKNEKLTSDRYIQRVTEDMQIASNKLEIAFEKMLKNSIKALEEYKSNEEISSIFEDFREALTINVRTYDRVYEDIQIVEGKSFHNVEELNFLPKYYILHDQFTVYNIVYRYMKAYADKITSTEKLVNKLKIGSLINIINKNYTFKTIAINPFYNNKISIGVIGALIATIIILGLGYFILFQILYFLASKQYDKTDEKYLQKYKVAKHFIHKSLGIPLKILLLIFMLDITQRIIFYQSNNLDAIYYADMVYAIILVWTLFRLIDNYVLTYSNNFLQQFPTVRAEVINFIIIGLRIFIVIVAVITILDNMNIDVKTLLTSLGIGGIALALAAKTSLENVFGSAAIILDDMFSQGDWIVTKRGQGTVVEIGLRSTKVRTFDNALTYYPNSYLATTEVKNFSKRKLGRRIKMEIGVAYTARIDDVMKAVNDIKEMLIKHEDVADATTEFDKNKLQTRSRVEKLEDLYGISKTLLVFLNEYGESSINILVYCFSKTVVWDEWLVVKQDVLYKIAGILKENNLEFAFPSESVYLSNAGDEPLNINMTSKELKI
ncbi:MAG: mechanosensitive ion channel [Helicobacteraceae bacterium]|nr:mechanosensitive ion channel [Helicobacteraceae bacterium]